MSEEIRNLELKLMDEKKFAVFSEKNPVLRLGNLKIKHYNSEIGSMIVHELSNECTSFEYILTQDITHDEVVERRENFYGEKVDFIETKYIENKTK